MKRRDHAPPAPVEPLLSCRLDSWLWHARIRSTRGACARLIIDRGVRINGHATDKPAAHVRQGDVLTFVTGSQVRVLRVLGIASRRGSAAVAARLFTDLGDR